MSVSQSVGKLLAGLSLENQRQDSDADLLKRFIATGDESAFAVLVQRHGPRVIGVCRRVLGHVQDAEDAAQAVFLVLARNARRVNNPGVLSAWLHGVAVRVSRKAFARRRRLSPLEDAGTLAVQAELLWSDAQQAVDESLAALPESLRLPLVLCYLEGLTRDEGAMQLGWPLATFRGRLERGREKLRAALTRRGFTLAAGLLVTLLESPAKASLLWVTETTALATGLVPTTPGISTLAKGVLPVISSPLLRALAITGVLALLTGLVVASHGTEEKPTQPPRIEPPPFPSKLLTHDPKLPAAAKEVAGTWRSVKTSPDGNTVRTETLQFLDDKNLVWQIHVRTPGVDSAVNLRGTYELTKEGELVFDVSAKWAGEEKLQVRAEEAHRVFRVRWSDKPNEFELANKDAKGDNTDSPWAVRQMKKLTDEKNAEPAIPTVLQKIERKIRKEPKYEGEPRYLLLVFGPEAKFAVWLVLDGTTLYLDRNGNGDLTEEGKKFDYKGKLKGGIFRGIELTEPSGVKHTNLMIGFVNLGTVLYAKMLVTVGGKTVQHAGPTNLVFSEFAGEAQIVHFGGTELVVRPSLSMPGYPDANAPADFRVQVGTAGIGPGSFASFASERVSEGSGPVAEFEFTPLKKDEVSRKITIPLTEKCCGDQFFAKVAVPEGVKTGINAAKVTLSFRACPWGKVPATTYFVDVMPLRK